jgi:hypothetical protein
MHDMELAGDMTMAGDLLGPDLAASLDGGGGDGGPRDGMGISDGIVVSDGVVINDGGVPGDGNNPGDGGRSDGAVADMALLPDMAAAPGPSALLLVHVGDGNGALSSAAAQVVVRKLKFDGTELKVDAFPLALPVAANGKNQPLTVGGSTSSEGVLSLSSDGRWAVLAGYAAAPGTAAVAGTASMATNRVIARIDGKGGFDTSTRLTAAYDGNNIRSATSDDGTRFWTGGNGGGAAGGVQLIAFGQTAPGTQILATPANTRVVHAIGGQLWVTSGSNNYTTVLGVGVGLPAMGGQVASVGNGLAATGASPYSFAVFDLDKNVAGVDAIYIADDTGAGKGGVQKWVFDGAKWTLTTLSTTTVRGLCAVDNAGKVTIFATTTETMANTVITLVDDGNPMVKVISTAPANTVYRGIAFSPYN